LQRQQTEKDKQNVGFPPQGRIKGEQRGKLPRAPSCKGDLPGWNLFVSNKILLERFRDSEAIQEYNSILYSYVALSIKGPQQQLISLQVWLSASFSNRHWIA